VSDGATTWVYDGGSRTYWKQTGGAPTALFSNAFPGLARQLSSANLPSVITAATLSGAESLTIDGRGYLCDIVDVTVVPSASNSALKDNLLHLWISREFKVPLKVEATFAGATPADLKTYSDYVTDFEPNLNIPRSTWTFNPPPDAKQRSATAGPTQKNCTSGRSLGTPDSPALRSPKLEKLARDNRRPSLPKQRALWNSQPKLPSRTSGHISPGVTMYFAHRRGVNVAFWPPAPALPVTPKKRSLL
jgi:hypothetical protein